MFHFFHLRQMRPTFLGSSCISESPALQLAGNDIEKEWLWLWLNRFSSEEKGEIETKEEEKDKGGGGRRETVEGRRWKGKGGKREGGWEEGDKNLSCQSFHGSANSDSWDTSNLASSPPCEGRTALFPKEVMRESDLSLMLCHHRLGACWKVPSQAAHWTQVFMHLVCHRLAS